MPSYRVISSDSHVVEPPDLWQERIDRRFRDRAPYLAHEETTDQWYADGDMKFGTIGVAGQAGQRFEDASKLSFGGRYEELIPKGGYDPHAHVKDMDVDGVAGGVVYPTQVLSVFSVPDSELLSAIFRAYNDWLADFCKPYPNRLKGIPVINVDDVADGVAELERCAKMGLVGAIIATGPLEHRYDHPMYEPLWAAAQNLGMPLSLHVAGVRAKERLASHLAEELNNDPVIFANIDSSMRVSLSAIILAGVFERYPRLRVGAVEFEVAWAPYVMRRLDDTYKDRVAGQVGYRYKGDALPSDFFRQNVFVSFQEDDLGMQMRHLVGVDNLLWGSDYPHGESTFPRSREILEQILQGVPEEEQAKIAGENCARLYGFN